MKLAKPLPLHASGNNAFRLSALFRIPGRKGDFNADSKSSKALLEFHEGIQSQLNSFHFSILSSSPPSSLLAWPWLQFSLSFLSDKHSQAMELFGFDSNLSELDKKQTQEYLDHSVKILELCNAITPTISHLRCSFLYLRYALNSLENNTTATADASSSRDFSKVKEALDSYRNSVRNGSVKARKIDTLLRELSDNDSLKFNKLKKKKIGCKTVMHPLHAVHSLVLLTFASIALALIPQEKEITTTTTTTTEMDLREIPHQESSIHNLLRLATEERESKTSVLGLSEFATLNDSVDELLDCLNNIHPGARLIELTQDLKQKLGNISSNLEEVGNKISDYFHFIIRSRSVLVEALGKFGSSQSESTSGKLQSRRK